MVPSAQPLGSVFVNSLAHHFHPRVPEIHQSYFINPTAVKLLTDLTVQPCKSQKLLIGSLRNSHTLPWVTVGVHRFIFRTLRHLLLHVIFTSISSKKYPMKCSDHPLCNNTHAILYLMSQKQVKRNY